MSKKVESVYSVPDEIWDINDVKIYTWQTEPGGNVYYLSEAHRDASAPHGAKKGSLVVRLNEVLHLCEDLYYCVSLRFERKGERK
jgi:hypothetical protein